MRIPGECHKNIRSGQQKRGANDNRHFSEDLQTQFFNWRITIYHPRPGRWRAAGSLWIAVDEALAQFLRLSFDDSQFARRNSWLVDVAKPNEVKIFAPWLRCESCRAPARWF